MRTMSTFDLPCSICGSTQDVEMHHIRHVRKNPYRDIEKISFKQMMALRNRKSIPVCQKCHRSKIHTGEYKDTALNKLIRSQPLVDNRIVHMESFVKPGPEYFSKTLPEKGWKEIN